MDIIAYVVGTVIFLLEGFNLQNFKKFNMHDCETLNIPMQPKLNLIKDEKTLHFKEQYKECLGILITL